MTMMLLMMMLMTMMMMMIMVSPVGELTQWRSRPVATSPGSPLQRPSYEAWPT
jgi:hypothetical protein